MRYIDCPECGAVESVHIDWKSDSDGDPGGMFGTRSWDYPDIGDVDCGCVLTAEHAETILEDVTKDGPPDDEPD